MTTDTPTPRALVWACCSSSIGPVCGHMAPPADEATPAPALVEHGPYLHTAAEAAALVVDMDNGPVRAALYNGHRMRRVEAYRGGYNVTDHGPADLWLRVELARLGYVPRARFTPDDAVDFVLDLLDTHPEHGLPLWEGHKAHRVHGDGDADDQPEADAWLVDELARLGYSPDAAA